MNSHTKEPWSLKHIRGSNVFIQEFEIRGMFGSAPHVSPIFNMDESAIDGTTIFTRPEDARRIVATINACKGISTDRLEKMVAGTLANLLTLKGAK